MREGKIDKKDMLKRKSTEKFDKTPKKASLLSQLNSSRETLSHKGGHGRAKSQGNIIEKVNSMLRDFEKEKRYVIYSKFLSLIWLLGVDFVETKKELKCSRNSKPKNALTGKESKSKFFH